MAIYDIYNEDDRVTVEGGTGNDTIENDGNSVTINGGAGDDSIRNYGYSVTINGGAGNDSIENYGDDVTVTGGAGNDTIFGTFWSSSINGGAGNDSIENYGDDVTVTGGAGNDTIYMYSYDGYNYIQYENGDGDDVVYGIKENDTVSITGGSYSTVLSGDDLKINVGNGSILIKNGDRSSFYINNTYKPENRNIVLTSGNDSIYSSEGDITISALAGNDTLYISGYGNMLIDGGAGNDSIRNYGSGSSGYDSISSSYYYNYVTINGGDDGDNIYNQGSRVSINGGDGNDTINNYSSMSSYYGSYVSINGGAGADLISLDSGSKQALIQYENGDGNDTIYGLNSDDTVSITGSSYSTVLSGDDLKINVGNDSILVKDGNIKSFYINGTYKPINKNIVLTSSNDSFSNSISGATISGLAGNDTISNSGGGSVLIDGGAGNDSINNFGSGSVSSLSGYYSSMSSSYYYNYVSVNGGDGGDYIYNEGSRVSINGGAGNDTIFNYSSYGSMTSYYGNYVSINGGAGNDVISLSGSNHFNVIEYASGDGNDDVLGITSNDTLKISGAEYETVKSGTDLVFTVGNGKITVKGGVNAGFKVDGTLKGGTGDDTEENILKGTTKADTLTNYQYDYTIDALAGNDKIKNDGSNVTIIGGTGNDTITNTGENILYKFGSSDGKDTIIGFSENDTLQITKGAIKSSLVSGSDLVLNIGSAAVTLKDMKGGSTFHLIDEKGNTSTVTVPKIVQGTTKADTLTNTTDGYTIDALGGNDKIKNDGSNVTIIGGAGNDTITNTGENILYKFGSSDGKDTVIGFSENDTLQITKGAIKSSLVSGSDLVLNIGSAAVTLKDVGGQTLNLIDEKGKASTLIIPFVHTLTKSANEFTNEDSEYLVDALAGNDTLENYGELVTVDAGDGNDYVYNEGASSSIIGGKGNDSIENFAGYSTVNGGDGNDVIYSYADEVLIDGDKSNDIIDVFGEGNTVIGGKGNDTITNGGSNNLYRYASGDGKDLIVGFSEDDTLQITNGTAKASVKGMDVIFKVGSSTVTLEDAAGKNINLMDASGKLTSSVYSGIWEGTGKADTLANSIENVTLNMNGGNDSVTNYAADVTIDGGAGHDKISLYENTTVIGGKGNDTITNDGANNLYQYANGDGRDVIFGFNSKDTLQITNGKVSSKTVKNGDTIIKVGTGTITLKDYSGSVNLVDNKNSKISAQTLDLLDNNNFVTDEFGLDDITEAKFEVTQIQTANTDIAQDDKTLITFTEK